MKTIGSGKGRAARRRGATLQSQDVRYWREVRLIAEELLQRYHSRDLPRFKDVLAEARLFAATHPWIVDTGETAFILAATAHPDAGKHAKAHRRTRAARALLADVLLALARCVKVAIAEIG